MNHTCATCKHWTRNDSAPPESGMGMCRESSPQLSFLIIPGPPKMNLASGQQETQMMVRGFSGWPECQEEQSCGKWASPFAKAIALQ